MIEGWFNRESAFNDRGEKVEMWKKIFRSFPFVPPPPPITLCSPQLLSTCHYIVNHHVKILHMRLGGANNMHPLSWRGWGAQTEKIQNFYIIFQAPGRNFHSPDTTHSKANMSSLEIWNLWTTTTGIISASFSRPQNGEKQTTLSKSMFWILSKIPTFYCTRVWRNVVWFWTT